PTRGREGAASDPGHIRTTTRLRFFRPCPGWRQVALMGRTDQRFTHLRKKVFGRCPPCLLSRTSHPANRVSPPHRNPLQDRPISAPTSGSSRSCTSATWRTRVPSTGRGGASLPTTSPLSPTERDPSQSSAASPLRPRPPRRRPQLPGRLRRSHLTRRALRPRRLPRLRRPPRPRRHLPLPSPLP